MSNKNSNNARDTNRAERNKVKTALRQQDTERVGMLTAFFNRLRKKKKGK